MKHRMNTWATHLPLLVRAVQMTKGPVIEVGGGLYSTPILTAMLQDRPLVTAETSEVWLERIREMDLHTNPLHATRRLLSLDELSDPKVVGFSEFGLAFVDNFPDKSRAAVLQTMRRISAVVVMHDAGGEAQGVDMWSRMKGARESIESFKFFEYYTRLSPHTAIMSDRIDVKGCIA